MLPQRRPGALSGTQGIARTARLSNEQAGARILLEVLGVHRHAADEKRWTAEFIGRIGHRGAERESGKPARMRREAADAAELGERACTFGERGLRNLRRRGPRASVLSGRHGSIVARAIFKVGDGSEASGGSRQRRLYFQVEAGSEWVPIEALPEETRRLNCKWV